MKKDKEVVLAAVQQDGRVLIYATWNDKDVRKVIYERCINDGDYCNILHVDFKKDKHN